MTEERAREILGDVIIRPDNSLYCLGHYISWKPGRGRRQSKACLDDDFTADELEAIAWWMQWVQNKGAIE